MATNNSYYAQGLKDELELCRGTLKPFAGKLVPRHYGMYQSEDRQQLCVILEDYGDPLDPPAMFPNVAKKVVEYDGTPSESQARRIFMNREQS